jgi:hypothetical protein
MARIARSLVHHEVKAPQVIRYPKTSYLLVVWIPHDEPILALLALHTFTHAFHTKQTTARKLPVHNVFHLHMNNVATRSNGPYPFTLSGFKYF